MIVELVGLPGSGKTTFAKRLAGGGEWTVVKINGTGELLFYNTLFLFHYPLQFFRTLAWLCRHSGPRELRYTKFANLFLVHNAKYVKAGRFSRAIIDQGHHQNIISLFDERVADAYIDRYLELLPKPDLLVFFVAPDDIRTKRLSVRGYGARDGMNEDYREAWTVAREAHFERLYVSRTMLPFATETVSPEDEEEKLKKISHARVWHFVLHGRMPTEKAHGLQSAKTLEAFARAGVYATLWIPRGGVIASTDIAEYYGLEQAFSARSFSVPNFLLLPGLFGPLRFWIDALYFFFMLTCTRVPRDGVFYTRSPELAWLFRLKGARAWYEAHLFPASKAWLLKFFLADVDGIIANSQGTADAYLQRGFHNVHVVRNGVDIERFSGIPPRDDARDLLGLPRGKTLIMYVGAFYAWKGVPFLLEAWQKYFSGRDDLLLVLVGGREDDLKKYGSLDAYRGTKNVLLVPHTIAAKAPLYLFAADILVLPNIPTTDESVHYTSPIKLFEYMASGRPIIAADLPSIREVLSEKMGMFFCAGDGEAFSDAVNDMLRLPERAKSLGDEAKRAVYTYSWAMRVQLLMSIVRGTPQNSINAHAQFLKSTASVGITATVYFSLIYLLTEYVGLWHIYSVFVAYVCAVVTNFLLLKLVFVGGMRKTTHEFFIFLLFALANLFVNEIAAYILVERLNLWYMLAQVLIIGTLAVGNFFVYRSYVFERGETRGKI